MLQGMLAGQAAHSGIKAWQEGRSSKPPMMPTQGAVQADKQAALQRNALQVSDLQAKLRQTEMMSSLQAQAVVQHLCFMLLGRVQHVLGLRLQFWFRFDTNMCSLGAMQDLVKTSSLCAASTSALQTSTLPDYAPHMCTDAWPGFAMHDMAAGQAKGA